jgi:hypothetical protein
MKLKLIAAAAVLAASGAQAAITTPAGGNSDLLVSFYSASSNATFTADLGITMSQFTSSVSASATGIKLVWDLDAGTFSDLSASSTGLSTQALNYGNVFTNFYSSSVASAADLQFGLIAADGAPTLGITTNRGVLVTADAGVTASATNANIINASGTGGVQTYMTAANGDTTNSTHGTAAAGANMFDSGDNQNVHVATGMGDKVNNYLPFSIYGADQNSLSFYALTTTSATGTGAGSVVKYSGTWSFDAATNSLIYQTAPVPEPETYAMLLAGLGLMGAVARRRRQA